MARGEPAICQVCAWRGECQKKFMGGHDRAFRCTEFTRDRGAREKESPNDTKDDRGDPRGGH